MAVQWCSSTSLNRWCHRPSPPPPPFQGWASSTVSQSQQPRRIGCVSAPREVAVAAAAEAAPPEVEANNAMEEVVECEGCGGTGWLLCDFCKGKKNNVKSESSPRIYRRCPTCKAAGYILCQRCRVYRCITYPESTES